MAKAPVVRRHETLVAALAAASEAAPEAELYAVTNDGESVEERVTRAGLVTRARAIASKLHELRAGGERAVLLYPPGIEYIAGFFGCLYAGTIAVPAYPPDPSRLNRTLPRLLAIIADCRADIVLTTSPILMMAEMLFQQAPDLRSKRWIATDTVELGRAADYRDPGISSENIAFLQYTSGSTGSPKGVILTHENLTHNEELISYAMQLDADSVVMSWLPPYHDMGLIGGILGPLYSGGRAVLMSPISFLQRPLRWMKAVSSFRATVSGGPNFAYDLCVRKTNEADRQGLDFSAWRVAFSGAEPVRLETLERFSEAFGSAGFSRRAFFPCYGLAEGALIVSGGRVSEEPRSCWVDAELLERRKVRFVEGSTPQNEARALVGCGTSLLDQDVVIADPETQKTAEKGAIGEIWVRGGSVSRGYWQRPEATAEAFGAKLADTGEGPYLRTGDLGFFDGDELYVAGRAKDVVIIRGRNYYPQDVERVAEESHPLVRRGCSAVFSIEAGGEERLGLCIEVERGFDAGKNDAPSDVAKAVFAALRNAVAEAFDVRVHAIGLLKAGAIPKTSSGKIQRRETRAAFRRGGAEIDELLRDVMVEPAKVEAPFVAPRTHTEELIAGLWMEVLGVTRVGVADDFFSLGGHSLAATQAVGRVREALQVEVTLRGLFESPTLAAFAEHVESLRAEGSDKTRVSLVRNDELGDQPLALAQERLLFLEELMAGQATYHIPAVLRLEGALDIAVLEGAIDLVSKRHAALRTALVHSDAGPVQRVVSDATLVLQRADLSDEANPAAALEGLVFQEITAPFDLGRAPLARLALVKLGALEHALVLTMHHLISDGWSVGVFIRDLSLAYEASLEGRSPAWAPLPVSYADYARFQRAWLATGVLEAQLAHFRKSLDGAPEALDLPTDRPRPAAQSYRGARLALLIPKLLTEELQQMARRQGTTLYAVLVAAYALLLARWSGQKDLTIGTPVANRARKEAEGLVGFFVSTLVLRADLSGDPTVSELVSRMREVSLGALANQDVPFERLVEELAPRRDLGRSPLFQAFFALQNVPRPAGRMGPIALSGQGVGTGTSKFDLALELTEVDAQLDGFFEYATDLFDADTVGRMGEQLLRLLEGIAKSPEKKAFSLPMMDAEERRELLVSRNQTALAFPEQATIHELFEAEVDRDKDRVALVFEGAALTYGELDARANQLAHHLRKLGVGPDVLVGLLVERSAEMVVAMLGISKAGGAYVPLDPAYPSERIAFVLADAKASVLVTQAHLAEAYAASGAHVVRLDADRALLTNEPQTRVGRSSGPLDLAYAIYTSGSTGQPKGVAIAHRSLVSFVRAIQSRPGLRPEDRLLAVTSLSFDIAGLEIFAPLTLGACVEVASRETTSDGALLTSRIEEGGITVFQATPATYRMMLDAGFQGKEGLVMLVGGEALPLALAESLAAKGAALWNMYGPTETTIWSTTCEIPLDPKRISIGTPLGNNTVYVLDERREPVPHGVRGELYIGGVGVARGYVNRPEMTAERFVSDPFVEQSAMRAEGELSPRLYRTGDLVRWLPDGDLEFLGRLDHQVKIRGYRIELGEIEGALGKHMGVRETVVVAEERGGDRRLVAYVALIDAVRVPASDLRAHLRTTLPEYMVPSVLVFVDDLPRTPNGKIDRKRLPKAEARSENEGGAAPRSSLEQKLATLWTKVLGVDRVSVSDDFFELGGHSLLATQLMARVRAELDVELPLRALFEAPTLEAFAARVEGAHGASSAGPPKVTRVERAGELLPSFAQERMAVLAAMGGDDGGVYNVSAALRFRGQLNVDALSKSLSALVERHEVLRTRLIRVGVKTLQGIEPAMPLALPLTSLEGIDAEKQLDEVAAWSRKDALQTFDLSQAPLLRARLVRLSEHEHVLLFTMHHIVSDEQSRGVLLNEIALFYSGFLDNQGPSLPDLPVQYADYAAWQRSWLEGSALTTGLSYWRAKLGTAPTSHSLPTDRPRSRAPSFRGERLPATVSPELTVRARAFARSEGLTLYMTLLAAYFATLHRHGAGSDIVVGTPIANRPRPELWGLVGYFANTLALRVDLADAPSFRELCRRTRETCLGAYAHQDVPFERVVEEVVKQREAGQNPLFQLLFVLQSEPPPPPRLPGLEVGWLDLDAGTAKFDLGLDFTPVGAGLVGFIELSKDLFDAPTVKRFVEHYATLLDAALGAPDAPITTLDMTSEAERKALLEGAVGGGKKLAALRAVLRKNK